MHDLLDGQVAIVTGASRGIGQAIATVLASRGATVVGTATTDAGVLGIDRMLATAGLRGFGCLLDVNDEAQIKVLLERTLGEFDRVSILVNNAGITRDGLAVRMSDADWDLVIDTDLRGVYRLTRAVLRPMMKARYGRIVNVTSVVAAMGNAGQANYAAAKAGVEGMSRALAKELGSRSITVNCVAPGFIDTDMTRALSQTQRQAIETLIPLGRLGRTEDVACAVAFLASEQAGYLTGTTLHVNGGLYMT